MRDLIDDNLDELGYHCVDEITSLTVECVGSITVHFSEIPFEVKVGETYAFKIERGGGVGYKSMVVKCIDSELVTFIEV